VAIHLEAVNHCLLSREELRQYVADNQIADVVSIPQDGESGLLTRAGNGEDDETHRCGDCCRGRV
jgi:hypothetical protein